MSADFCQQLNIARGTSINQVNHDVFFNTKKYIFSYEKIQKSQWYRAAVEIWHWFSALPAGRVY